MRDWRPAFAATALAATTLASGNPAAHAAAAPTCDSRFNVTRWGNVVPWSETSRTGSRTFTANARVAKALACLVNAERARHRLPRLTAAYALGRAAQRHAREAASQQWWHPTDGRGTHLNPATNSTPKTRVADAGYCPGASWDISEVTYAGAKGAGLASRALNWWVNVSTQGHRGAVLDSAWTHFGYWATGQSAFRRHARAKDGGTFVVVFGRCSR
ncbi:CAP domain-containing protein [Sinosporangium siamense]|uniref:SCP domain-containing protein n=1 Tax=Sinosporangium siamense TaxID=1367973 RepID=A0A919RP33_9ACTN|nr:CAP domain-containing protein [Sinosporangium siamense]GII97330.1 hypothetical protein Ssi02_75610 [Sinosporangium siamense]